MAREYRYFCKKCEIFFTKDYANINERCPECNNFARLEWSKKHAADDAQ